MLSYILYNTLVYGTIAFLISAFYAYGKFMHAALGGYMIIGTYIVVSVIKYGRSWNTVLIILGVLIIYRLMNTIVIRSFTNEKQRDLFGLIFTLGGSIAIENVVNIIYWPSAISLSLRTRTPAALITTLVVINLLIVYLFHRSFNGAIRQAIYANAGSVRSLGVRVWRMLTILMSAVLPIVVTLGVIIANEWAIKPSDNLFYLIKGIGIMIMVGMDKRQYVYLGALIYVVIEYLLFITRGLPIGFKETLILLMILLILLVKPSWLFSMRTRKI